MIESELLKSLEEHANAEKNFDKVISNKKDAISLLNKIHREKELFFAYEYAISDFLKSDLDIYNLVKSRLSFNSKTKLVDYTRSFVHSYGEACGANQKIEQALNEMKKLPQYYAYWLFYSLYYSTDISFDIYKNVYTSFDETTIQGFLLNHYCNSKNAKRNEVVELIKLSSSQCLSENYFFITHKFHDEEIFELLIKNGVSSEKLKNFQRYIN